MLSSLKGKTSLKCWSIEAHSLTDPVSSIFLANNYPAIVQSIGEIVKDDLFKTSLISPSVVKSTVTETMCL